MIETVTLAPSGGLKGNMAPGDAHPYLAPFWLEKIFKKLNSPPYYYGGTYV
jgi:hypothetical protein